MLKILSIMTNDIKYLRTKTTKVIFVVETFDKSRKQKCKKTLKKLNIISLLVVQTSINELNKKTKSR